MEESGIIEKSNKFIGGAERARRAARKRLRTCGGFQNKPQHHKSSQQRNHYDYIPKSIPPMERFLGALLSNCTSLDLLESRDDFMKKACQLLNLPLPTKLPSWYRNAHEYYSMRATLVLEEARFILANALLLVDPQWMKQKRDADSSSIQVKLIAMQETKRGNATRLMFEKKQEITPKEMYYLRVGTIFAIQPLQLLGDGRRDESCFVLGSFTPTNNNNNNNNDDESYNTSISLLIFERYNNLWEQEQTHNPYYRLVPLTSLISQIRQFEACTNTKQSSSVSFMPKLLAWKEPTHIKFNTDSSLDDEKVEEEESKGQHQCKSDADQKKSTANDSVSAWTQELNASQEEAATTFLNSPSGTLTLVQGPPGTGKTTFLVSVLIQCLKQQQRRILVAAPTNKAIAVLATRFLLQCKSVGNDFNAILIGVEDKLLFQSTTMTHQSSSFDPLTEVFVYTWTQTMVTKLREVHAALIKNGVMQVSRAKETIVKLTRSMPASLKSCGALGPSRRLLDELERDDYSSEHAQLASMLKVVMDKLQLLNEAQVVQELLATADVVFCTLSSAGVSAMKQTKRVDDLLVDEAAAATEPELCIPFHLGPRRMLAVGDPMQLPASVSSKVASDLGLSKSLHERLMYDCNKPHVMLNVQYRMHPEICQFPSQRFYRGNLRNGNNVKAPPYMYSDQRPYTFLQVNGREERLKSGSYANKEEASAVVRLIKDIANQTANTTKQEADPWYSPNRLRVITFYQGQVTLLSRILVQRGLGNVLVATVDSSQGCEADTVIVSFVRSNGKCVANNNKKKEKKQAGFLADDRRVNVAITRARHQLICVGDAEGTLCQSRSETLQAMVQDAKNRNLLQRYDSKNVQS